MRKKYILNIKNLTKKFPGVLAVNKANLDIEAGKIHAIVGGNGAGKSTLMKVLAGVYPYNTYEGEFFLDNILCRFSSVIEAEKNGIAMVPQELNMVNDMTVADNLFLNKLPNKTGIVDTYALYDAAQGIIDEFGLDVSPTTMVGEIGIAQKQLIVIARAMYNKIKVLILDEPTATLSDTETQLLFEKVEKLKKSGITCIYISHRLEDVRKLADVVTVIRDGNIIETSLIEEISDRRIVSLMVGKDVSDFYPSKNHAIGDVVLSVKSINVYDPELPDKRIVKDVSFDLRKGELLALYGLVGSGRSEMALGIIGAWRGQVESEIIFNEKRISLNSPAEAVKAGIGFLPEDRPRQGIIDRLSVGTNISASSLEGMAKGGYVDAKVEKEEQQNIFDSLFIKANNIDTLINTLSGGNQQKSILGRLIAADSQILVLDEATQGVDVESKTQIYNILNELCDKGKSIIFISSDLSEVLGISDRILVLHQGRLINNICTEDATREEVIWNATVGQTEGGKSNE